MDELAIDFYTRVGPVSNLLECVRSIRFFCSVSVFLHIFSKRIPDRNGTKRIGRELMIDPQNIYRHTPTDKSRTNMLKLNKQVETIAETLKLETKPIGIKFSKNPRLKYNHPKIEICKALALALQRNLMITISKENCTCSGGRHFMGFEILPLENLAIALTNKNHKVYESKRTAVASIKKQPQPVHRGDFVILGPLDKFETQPDIVLFRANPEQADRLLGLASFRGAEPFLCYPASSVCSTIAYALAKGKPDVNLISAFERKSDEWSPNELLIALPFRDFVAAIESIPYSGFAKRRAS